MNKNIKAVVVIFVLSTIEVVSAVNLEMITYTNEEQYFSIEYPENWRMEEALGGVSFTSPEKMGGGHPTLNIIPEKLAWEMSPEEYAKAGIESQRGFYIKYQIENEYNTVINDKDAYVIIALIAMTFAGKKGEDVTSKQVYITNNLTGYVITAMGPLEYEKVDEKYFEPMIQSFKLLPKTIGIEIQNFRVTSTKIEMGKEVTIKFDAVNKASVEKTKTFHCSYIALREGGVAGMPEEIDYKTVTLAPGDDEHITFTYAPNETGTYLIKVEDQGGFVEVVEKISIAPEFGVVFAIVVIAGLLVMAYLLTMRK